MSSEAELPSVICTNLRHIVTPPLAPEESSDDDESRGLSENKPKECEQTSPRKRSVLRRVVRILFLVLLVWTIEFCMLIILKHFGIVDPRFTFEEAVVESVLPQLEEWRMLNISLSMSFLPYFRGIEHSFADIDPFASLVNEKKRPGYRLRQAGATPEYPIVLVPGFVTSGLEVWNGKECARSHFRRRLWAALVGARSFLIDRDCWREHMALDPFTGKDPEGIKLRAAQGFDAADYFIVNYWVFGKIIENLADLGYTPSSMTMEPYDWRLSFPKLEERDGYLTHLKHKIEAMHSISGKKVVLTSHSMGALLVHHFFTWVATPKRRGGGGGGRGWVDKHIHAYVNIAGSHLGVPKAGTALLSGEMSDTVVGGTMGNSMVEQFFGRRHRRDLWSTWGSLWSMLPTGAAIWGTGVDLCPGRQDNDPFCHESKETPMLLVSHDETFTTEDTRLLAPELREVFERAKLKTNHSVLDLVDLLGKLGASHGSNLANTEVVTGVKSWHDPTKNPLPRAPGMKIFCFYGTGVPTERAYHYRVNHDANSAEAGLPLILDHSVENKLHNTTLGIRYANGDGSVPLLSLGYMCADAWHRKENGLNPSQIPIFTREYKHEPGFTVDDPMRGGPHSADHVDILGHEEMMEDLLRIVSDFDVQSVEEDHIESRILEIGENIHRQLGPRRRKQIWQ